MSRPTTAIARGPSGFPDNLFVKLKFTCRLFQTHAAGTAALHVFRGNSLYDPDYTTGGIQPYGHDQWSQFYEYYTVYGSSIKATLFPSTNTYQAYDIAVVPSSETTATSAATLTAPIEEMPYSRYRTVTSYNTGTKSSIVRHYMSTAKIFGANPLAIKTEDSYSAVYNANPASIWYWLVYTQPSDEATANSNNITITITYYCEYSDRRNLTTS